MKGNYLKFLFLTLLILPSIFSVSQNQYHIDLKWQAITLENGDKAPTFKDASFQGNIPYYIKGIPVSHNGYTAKISNLVYTSLDKKFSKVLDTKTDFPHNQLETKVFKDRQQNVLWIEVFPFIKDDNGNYQKLLSFDLETIERPSLKRNDNNPVLNNTSSSLLSSGKWLQFQISKTGVYKIKVEELIKQGLEPNNGLRLFGYGGAVLSEKNSDVVHDDMEELSLLIDKGSNNILDASDFVYFYAEGPTTWKYNKSSKEFVHQIHYYSKTISYFIASGIGNTKGLGSLPNTSNGLEAQNINVFKEALVHEKNLENPRKTGRTWFGEKFHNLSPKLELSFKPANLVTDSLVELTTKAYARAPRASYLYIDANGKRVQKTRMLPVDLNNSNFSTYMGSGYSHDSFKINSKTIKLDITYSESDDYFAHLDYLRLSVVRQLKKSNRFLSFTNIYNIGGANKYTIQNTKANTLVWDISDIANVKVINPNHQTNSLSFTADASEVKSYMIFDKSDAFSIRQFKTIQNQNLHQLKNIDYVILTHRNFIEEAEALANFHKEKNNLKTIVVSNEQVYNEFSSGTPDITAIKNFMRHLYFNRSFSDTLKYLLLFGDGSFDNINHSEDNSNFILTFQTINSLSEMHSLVSDDYFTLLDPNEGYFYSKLQGNMDICVGRMPINNKEQAQTAINKVMNYAQQKESFGTWRNTFTLVADNLDGGVHMGQSEKIADAIETYFPNWNIKKIYMESYPLIESAGSNAVPEMNEEINRTIHKGTLFFNFMGHGNPRALTHESVITLTDIKSWHNASKLMVFVTATCEFTPFDDKDRVSGGELLFLSQKGGAIALLTTTRATAIGSNGKAASKIYKFLSVSDNYTLGDCLRRVKNQESLSTNIQKYVLIGDPALPILIPKYKVKTQTLNNITINDLDSVKINPLEKVTFKGQILNKQGVKQDNFNGILYATLYDKPDTTITLGHGPTEPFAYKNFKNIIYKGKAQVVNGDFSYTFIVPKDVSYKNGLGKISYYATNYKEDAAGHNGNLAISHNISNTVTDKEGPSIELFMNDEDFIYGGTTNEAPVLLAHLFDENGINTVGNGIGHDIIAVLDKDTKNAVVLNDYYESDINSYQSGKLKYPYQKLKEGRHMIHFKVWDVVNNSSEQNIDFFVSKSSKMAIDHIFNYPNPFTTNTEFFFNHNQSNTNLDILIQIFSVSGKLVKSIETNVMTEGFNIEGIKWDGKDDYGDDIGRGVYIYKLKVQNEEGESVTEFEKLVILK